MRGVCNLPPFSAPSLASPFEGEVARRAGGGRNKKEKAALRTAFPKPFVI